MTLFSFDLKYSQSSKLPSPPASAKTLRFERIYSFSGQFGGGLGHGLAQPPIYMAKRRQGGLILRF
jgi:hypothetical protein